MIKLYRFFKGLDYIFTNLMPSNYNSFNKTKKGVLLVIISVFFG